MLGEQDPTARRQGKEEYRRDLPLGLGTSTIVHVIAVFMLLSGALVYTVSRTPEPTPGEEPDHHDRNVGAHAAKRSATHAHRTISKTHPSRGLPADAYEHDCSQCIRQRTAPDTARRGSTGPWLTLRRALARSCCPGSSPQRLPKYTRPAPARQQTRSRPHRRPAKASRHRPRTTHTNRPMDMAAHVMSEHAPSGPLGGGGGDSSFGGITIGHGHDDCTPSRGGFFR